MSRVLHGRGYSNSLRLDITVVQCSFGLMIVGALAIGVGSNAASLIAGELKASYMSKYKMNVLINSAIGSVLLACGGGIPSAMQGMFATYAKSKGNDTAMGQIYAGLAIAELAAGLFGSLAYAGLLNVGLKLGGWGFGLPYYISAVSYQSRCHCAILWLLTHVADTPLCGLSVDEHTYPEPIKHRPRRRLMLQSTLYG